ncbi:MAG: HD-GYP domain-containing protein [Phycisphaerae bacterium]
MSTAKFRLICPDSVADYLREGRLRDAVQTVARLAGAELAVGLDGSDDGEGAVGGEPAHIRERCIAYRGKPVGRLVYSVDASDVNRDLGDRRAHLAEDAAGALASVIEHIVDREASVSDLADALMTNYEELNLLYTLIPTIATRVRPSEIGDVLVEQTARTLNCRRVSLLVLDEKRKHYEVIASRGLPPEVNRLSIPIADTIAERAVWEEDLLVVNDISERPDLAGLSRGSYDSSSFAVVRVPLEAHGEALGLLTATERTGATEFTARDRKLLEGLSAMGASALLNCRLHTAVNKQMMSTIHALASAVDAKDSYTHDHSGRVAQLCVATARELGVTDPVQCREVELAGLLHDIGKIGVPDAVLCKPAKLTREEYLLIRKHVDIGARIVEHVPDLEGVANAIYHHHERHDGLGYPSGLAGDAIPLAARLIAVADTVDALTTDRPYRKACSLKAALEELNRCKGTQFDPMVVDAYIAVIGRGIDSPRPLKQTVVTI